MRYVVQTVEVMRCYVPETNGTKIIKRVIGEIECRSMQEAKEIAKALDAVFAPTNDPNNTEWTVREAKPYLKVHTHKGNAYLADYMLEDIASEYMK